MLKGIISYIWGTPTPNISLDDALDALKIDDSIEKLGKQVDDEISDYVCYHRTGIVTSVTENHFVIDNLYTCSKANLNIAVGTKVSFICYTVKSTVRISNIDILDNEWNCIDSDKKSSWCYRNIIGNVSRREGRNIIMEPGNISVNLNEVSSEFVPSIGDWLQLDVKAEIDENVTDLSGKILDIQKISPLRHKVVEGTVKTWDKITQTGTINYNIFFSRESLCAGYIPSLKDQIVAVVMESDQGKCTWRALKVLSSFDGKMKQVIESFIPQYEIDNDNIRISDDICIEFSNLGDSVHFKFEVTNLSSLDIILRDIITENLSQQCNILESLPLCIDVGKTINISGKCVIKTAGYSKELVIFCFDECKIGRWIEISHKHQNQYSNDNFRYTNKQSLMSNTRKYMQSNEKVVLKGPKPYVPARFVPNRLPDYQVASKLWDVFLNFDDGIYQIIDELKTIKPVFNQVLTFQNYEERFHTLLHLEEINSIIEIRRFDREQASFIRNGEYMMLEYENLSEQRPSIIIGDTILAKDSLCNGKTYLEGYVYKVGSKHVYLKFTQKFHEDYKGEDYSVSVIQSRTQFRRMHQAVGLAVKNLGRKFLFPTQITCVEPQMNFIYESYDDTLDNNTMKSMRLSHSELMKILRSSNANSTAENNTENANNSSAHVQKSKLNFDDTNYKISKNVLNKSKLKLEWFDKTLNYYQKEAVRHILLGETRPLPYFIFGPPGTGKTVTLVEVILQILYMAPSRILVATPSNSAANLICIRLINSGVLKPGDLVRLVSYKSINENSIPPILAPYCATASIGIQGTGSNASVVTEKGLALGCNSKTIGKHRITVGTCTSLGILYSLAFPKGHFSHVIIDEAGQATEPEAMIPLSFLDMSTGQCVLAGDPMQLGPVVCSKYASEFGLCESFMERLLNRFPYIRDSEGFPKTGGYDPKLVSKLIYNYRSLPGVLELPNSMFYFSELKSTISSEDSDLAKILLKFQEFLPKGNGNIPPSFVFHGVNGENYQLMDSPSWYNPHEISQVFYYVNELYRAGCTADDIGIVTPYSKQTKEIRAVLVEAELDVPKVGTIEEFQGQEFNVVILSTVRSNRNMLACDKLHNLGFVTQPKRLNVALTRAQALTIVIGNPHLLMNDSSWRYIIEFALKNGCYCGCDISIS